MTHQANNVQHQLKEPIHAWDTMVLVCIWGEGRGEQGLLHAVLLWFFH